MRDCNTNAFLHWARFEVFDFARSTAAVSASTGGGHHRLASPETVIGRLLVDRRRSRLGGWPLAHSEGRRTVAGHC